jgi:RNA polymerase sigma factor (sigma-70 family)
MPATALRVPLVRVRIGRLSDDRLAALAAAGDERAFEELYDRHHPALLGFCRHMLGSRDEGEDALQQTFLRAHRALLLHGPPEEVRPWLFAIARNRCRSMHAARKDAADPAADVEPVTDGLAADVEQRSDLRALLADIERLPEDQRSALVLAELADMPHAEIGAVIGVPASKVKALVHQARTHLIAERDARETPCEQIRAQLATARGGELRRGPLRRHLNACESCREYRKAVADQRIALGLILPVIPSAGLKDAVLGAIGGGGGGAAAAAGGTAGAASAGSAAMSGAGSVGLGAKLAIGAALLGTAGGGAVVVEKAVIDKPAAPAKAAAAAAKSAAAPAKGLATRLASTSPGEPAGGRSATRRDGQRGDVASRGKRRAHAYGRTKNADNGRRRHGTGSAKSGGGKRGASQGKALGRSGTTRKSEVQSRNAQRQTTQVQQRTERKAARQAPVKVPKVAPVKPAPMRKKPVPVPTVSPVPTFLPDTPEADVKTDKAGGSAQR